MPTTPADRCRYEADQAKLLHALARGDAFPAGFDAGMAGAASRSLRGKRRQAVAAAWPALTIAAHDQFAARFDEYARSTTPPAFGDGLTDGLAFARALPPDILTEEALIELLFARALATERAGALRPRRGIFLKTLTLHNPRRILLVLRAPGIGRHAVVIGPRTDRR